MATLSAREADVLDRLRRGCRNGDVMTASEFLPMFDPDSRGPYEAKMSVAKVRRALVALETKGLARSFDVRPKTYAPLAFPRKESDV